MVRKSCFSSTLAMVGLLMVFAAPASAQQAVEIGDYIVHYNTLNTNLLPPDVARAYGIQRAGTRALLNIAVLRKGDADMDTPVRAEVSASAVNLTAQRRQIRMQEISDQDAVYYIGTFRIHNEETLDFTIRVRPENSDRPAREINFRQQFFTG